MSDVIQHTFTESGESEVNNCHFDSMAEERSGLSVKGELKSTVFWYSLHEDVSPVQISMLKAQGLFCYGQRPRNLL